MASLTLVVGATTSTISATNAKAQEIFTLYLQSRNVPITGTAQQQLDAVRDEIVAHMTGAARAEKFRQSMVGSEVAAHDAEQAISWG